MKHKRDHHDRVIARNQLSNRLKVNAAQEMLGQGQSGQGQEQSTDLELQVNLYFQRVCHTGTYVYACHVK